MDRVLEVAGVLAGIALAGAALVSAIQTVVIPRAAASRVTRIVFRVMRRVYLVLAPRSAPYARRDKILASYAPVSLFATLAVWLAMVFTGFALIFWSIEDRGPVEAFELSGSSLLTLGMVRPQVGIDMWIVFVEAVIGLFLLALLITYLPSIYGAFSRRELGVTSLAVRAGEPPSGREMIWRHWVLERIEELHGVWTEWERWFVDVEETHTSLPALVFLRSPQPDHSWVTAAGAVLDGAALTLSSVEVPRDVQAEFTIRAGYLCLRRIADFFGVPYDPDPAPGDPISVTKEEWHATLATLEEAGVPLKADREQAWRDFAGWRVNYDAVLLALANLTTAPPAEWSSDRAGDRTWAPRALRRSPAR